MKNCLIVGKINSRALTTRSTGSDGNLNPADSGCLRLSGKAVSSTKSTVPSPAPTSIRPFLNNTNDRTP